MTSRGGGVSSVATRVAAALAPYLEAAPLAAASLGVSSSVAFAMIGATLTTRLAQHGIRKSTVTTFALAFLAYNLKFIWAPLVDTVRLPVLGRLGQRRSWLFVAGTLVMLSIAHLGRTDPDLALASVALAAVLVGACGATFDIVIDAYRIELLRPDQLGVGAGMSQYGWRIGAATAGAIALVVSARAGWSAAYAATALLAVPAMVVGVVMGEPVRGLHAASLRSAAGGEVLLRPFAEFLRRRGSVLVVCFVLLHKIGDTLANLTLRLLVEDLRFTNDEIAFYEVSVGLVALLAGVFAGGVLFSSVPMRRSVLVSLWLMAISNLGFSALAAYGHSAFGLALATAVENFTSGMGGVAVVAYLSSMCNLRYTASQYALLSALASVAGRILTGTTAGGLIEMLGYVNFYLMTTVLVLPGIALYWLMVERRMTGLDGEAPGTS